MKKVMAFFLVALLVVSLIPMSVSARNLTDAEKDLFVYLKEALAILDDGTKDVAGALAQGENYIASLAIPLTDEQINMIKSEVEKAVAAVEKEEAGASVKEWSSETRNEVLDRIDEAAGVVDCTAVADTKGTVTVKDQKGQTVVVATPNKTVIKPTGLDATGIFVAASAVMTLLCACAFVSKKAQLF